jgi:hypothetical protein
VQNLQMQSHKPGSQSGADIQQYEKKIAKKHQDFVQTVQNAKRVQNLPIQKSHRPGSQSGADIY